MGAEKKRGKLLRLLKGGFGSSKRDGSDRRLSADVTSDGGTPDTPQEPPQAPVAETRPFIKVRIATWNMNMALPAGELDELLGLIPPDLTKTSTGQGSNKRSQPSLRSSRHSSYTDRSVPVDRLPALPLDSAHPFHILVVGSQECPWVPSSFLGDLRGRQNVTWTDILTDYLCRGAGLETSPVLPQDAEERLDSPTSDHGPPPQGLGIPDPDLERMGVDVKDFAASPPSFPPASPSSPRSPLPPPPLTKRTSFMSNHSNASAEELEQIGPYALIAKERLMGIYIAVFVLKSCEGLVEGVSKGRVTAGLLNGRVGNKGATAVSLHFASFRLLFVSAHLAAHQDASAIRASNVNKIKEELEIDDFLPPRSPRHKQDLTDRFDYVFWLGDLNYRLDVSRLHADWLLANKSYETALQFDQLNALLKDKNSCFGGFQEAPIKFAPTYKYDLIQMPKRKPTRKQTVTRPRPSSAQSTNQVIQIPEYSQSRSSQVPSMSSPSSRQGELDFSDSASVSSVASAAFDPSGEVRPDMLADNISLSHSTFSAPPDPHENQHVPASVTRAKIKLMNMVRSQTSATVPLHQLLPALTDEDGDMSPPPTPKQETQDDIVFNLSRPPYRTSKTEISVPHAPKTDATFDTSKKQRVQSYTDRILFKTNIAPELPDHPSMPRRLGSGIVDGLRGLSRTLSHIPAAGHHTPSQPSSPIDMIRTQSTGHALDEHRKAPSNLIRRGSAHPSIISDSSSTHTHKALRIFRRQEEHTERLPRLSFSHNQARPHRTRANSEPAIDKVADHTLKPTQTIHAGDEPEQKATKASPAIPFTWRHFWFNLRHPPPAQADLEAPDSPVLLPLPPLEPKGPRRGEIECLVYDSANDLRRMQALTDHRPLFGVYALGATPE